MGLDYSVKFKKKITFKEEHNDNFSPFSRGLSQFIGNHLNGSESLLLKVENMTGIELQFITKSNLYDYFVDELQLEFAEGEEKDRLIQIQKELNKECYKAWYSIGEFLLNLNLSISKLSESDKLKLVEYDKKWWLYYLDNNEFINDLKNLSELLQEAKKQNQELFSFLLY